jgi:hypothetical protein
VPTNYELQEVEGCASTKDTDQDAENIDHEPASCVRFCAENGTMNITDLLEVSRSVLQLAFSLVLIIIEHVFMGYSPGPGCLVPHVWVGQRTTAPTWEMFHHTPSLGG